MDGLTHSLVGLTSAKAGLERWSPFATAVCILAANAPDIDAVTFLGGRWSVLHYHRGITHSIVGTFALGVVIPSLFYFIDWFKSKVRKGKMRIWYPGLLGASLLAAATHPLMDWTNNYGLRPLLPWSGRWFYGDLVFIVDPYIWLILGGAAFLVTSNRGLKIIAWSILAAGVTLLMFVTSARSASAGANLSIARTIWIAGISLFVLARFVKLHQRLGRSIAVGALAFVVIYWGTLAFAHYAAYEKASAVADQIVWPTGENVVRVAAMPTLGDARRWLCIAETDRAIYRFFVKLGTPVSTWPAADHNRIGSMPAVERFAKPVDGSERLVSLASRDPRAQILLGFARFPIERVENENCLDQTLVQFADLRYTEPGGASLGSFSLNVPVECSAP